MLVYFLALPSLLTSSFDFILVYVFMYVKYAGTLHHHNPAQQCTTYSVHSQIYGMSERDR